MNRDRLHAIPGMFRIVRCTRCGLMSLDPRPKETELEKYYPKTYYAYAHYKPGSWQERFAVFLYKLYFGRGNLLLKLALLPFKHLLRGTRIIPGGRILDVGCGNGSFLYKMKLAGMDAHGVELSREACAGACKLGLNVRCGTLEAQRYPAQHFDVITLNHVLEHVHQPVRMLREVQRILKPDGVVFIGVPNERSLAAKLFGRYWASLETPRHLMIPNPNAMRAFARKTGLRVQNIRYLSFPSQFHVSLAYLFARNRSVPMERAWLCTSRLAHAFCLPLAYLVDFLRIGDVIEATLTK